jgi:hypothetical protein
MNEATTLRIIGLDRLDEKELSTLIGTGDVEFDTIKVPGGTYGEPGTIIAVIIISVAAIKGLTAWLMKKRRQKTVEQTIETEYPDGRKERKVIRVDVSSSDPAEVMKQVGSAFEINPDLITKALG